MTATLERGIPIGLTGDISRDGILSLEQQEELDRLQQGAAFACMNYLEAKLPEEPFPLVAMATGVGKGKIIHELIRRQKDLNPESRILVIVGTKSMLIDQTAEALSQYQQDEEHLVNENEDAELEEMDFEKEEFEGYTFGKYGRRNIDVQLATFQKVQSERGRGRLNHSDFDLVIIDEVHNVGTQSRFNAVNDFARVVGFTATPHRFSGVMRSPQSYGFEIIASLPLPEAQERRILPPLYAAQINTLELLPAEQIPTTRNGRIDFPKLEKILKAHPELREFIAERAIPIINHDGKRHKTAVAVNFVWEAVELARCFRQRGVRVGLAVNQNAARSIHTDEIPALDTIRRHKLPEGDPESLQMIISPYVIGEGFDAPATEILMWASPTDSHLRYTQYTGRLARRHFGKAYGLVLDCLYQTSQYGWTYNFAMWMKGHVRQLHNGLLYLGPESEEARDLESLRSMHELSDNVDIRELQWEGILPLQENDLPLSQNWVQPIFGGDWFKLKTMIDEIAEEIKTSNKELYDGLFTLRVSGNHPVAVCTNRDFLVSQLLEKGAKPKLERPKDGEVHLTQINLPRIFVGNYDDSLRPMLNRVMAKVWQDDPEEYNKLFVKRMFGSEIDVCTNKARLVELMLAEGAQLRLEIPSERAQVREGDFVLTADNLGNTFVGGRSKALRNLVVEIRNRVPPGDVELFSWRNDDKGRPVEVVVNTERFIKLMLERGAKLKPAGLDPVQPGDLPLSATDIQGIFLGTWDELSGLMKRVVEKLEKTDTNLASFTQRKRGTATVRVFRDRSKFIELMVERGARLKDLSDDDLINVQEEDIVLSFEQMHAIFLTSWSRLKDMIAQVKTRVEKDFPDEYAQLFLTRKNSRSKSNVCTDKTRFIQWLQEEGAQLREVPLSVRKKNGKYTRKTP